MERKLLVLLYGKWTVHHLERLTNTFHLDPDTAQVANIAAIGNNVKGVVGVIPNADSISGIKLHIGKGLTGGGSGNSAVVLAAVAACVENGANVISMSLGGGGYSQTENSAYEDVYLNDSVLIIAAARNGWNSGISYPASYPSVMSVAAVDSRYNRASFSRCMAGWRFLA
jgi:serine protease